MSTKSCGLGRVYSPDPHDRLYPAPLVLRTARPGMLRKRPYKIPAPLDQGGSSHCVGHSGKHFLLSAPLLTKTGPSALELMRGAEDNDEWEANRDVGSSVRGGVAFLQKLGHVSNYVWMQNIAQAKRWLKSGFGTLWVGSDWKTGMFSTDSDGYVSLLGADEGGHAYLCFWYDEAKDDFWHLNSWGEWGLGGKGIFKIRGKDWEYLMFMANGEVCGPTERRVKPLVA